jgi:hypothetical protein
MRRGRFVAILQPLGRGTAGGAAAGQRCAGLTGWKRKESIVSGNQAVFVSVSMALKQGFSRRGMDRKAGRSAYN